MPLILITGRPSCGKTTRANQLKKAFEQKIRDSGSALTVELINDESLSISKETYRNLHTEKATRGAQQSAVKRVLSKSRIVILDNLNYIKGVRYQLFCEAKALLTNYCVVQVGAPDDQCRIWNAQREDPWPQDLFDALNFRYEEPNAMARWDSPLFTISHNDPQNLTETPLIEEMWETLVLSKPKPPNQATVLKPATSANYLTEMERITVSIVNQAQQMHSQNPSGILNTEYGQVNMPLRLSVADLNRCRRNFVMLNKMKPMDVSRIGPMFIDFLGKHWDRED